MFNTELLKLASYHCYKGAEVTSKIIRTKHHCHSFLAYADSQTQAQLWTKSYNNG